MKTLEKEMQILYRFRCERCRSLFEILPHVLGMPEIVNPMDNFDCPVCNTKRYVRRGDMHRFHIMDNGHEVQDY